MRDIEIFTSVVKGTPLRTVAEKNYLSSTRVAQIVKRVARIIVKHDPYMEPVKHSSIAYLRERSELWVWASSQFE